MVLSMSCRSGKRAVIAYIRLHSFLSSSTILDGQQSRPSLMLSVMGGKQYCLTLPSKLRKKSRGRRQVLLRLHRRRRGGRPCLRLRRLVEAAFKLHVQVRQQIGRHHHLSLPCRNSLHPNRLLLLAASTRHISPPQMNTNNRFTRARKRN